jgi:hypothetical protein
MNDEANAVREIPIKWDGQTAQALFDLLDPYLDPDQVALSVKTIHAQGAITDPAILVALVSGAGAAITALITGLLQLAQERRQRIILQATNGRRLEIPANTSPERIEELLDILRQMEIERIRIAS